MPLQARTEFAAAINQIASEKGVDTSVVIEAIEQAALAAYRKDLSLRGEAIPEDFESLEAKIDSASGEISIYRGKENITPPGFARIAAQTAKQVIAQRLHEAEKGAIMEEYDKKVGLVISGMIQRQEGNTYFIDLGRAEGVMPPSEQTRDEVYLPNQRLKVLVKQIRESGHGPEVVVSRSDAALVKGLFAMEVPEIQSGAVEIKEIAREAGGRTKLAAISHQDGVDPVGSLVGQKGVRVQAVTNELGEEKIDIVSFSDDPARFIASALAPAKDVEVILDEENRVAKVKVADNQLSLAIGKGGQNVRLAAKLTGWKIDIEGTGEGLEEVAKPDEAKEESPSAKASGDEEGTKERKDVVEDGQTTIPATDDSNQAAKTEKEASQSASDAESDMEQEDKKESAEKADEKKD
ncbi:transcription termination factor NusA [Candidatus Daviesbacteria bacterium]|nr:transcription termination factor NusA [Candidatus Daviesbacteria bacterium]